MPGPCRFLGAAQCSPRARGLQTRGVGQALRRRPHDSPGESARLSVTGCGCGLNGAAGRRTKCSFGRFSHPGLLPPALALRRAHAWSGAEAGRLGGRAGVQKPRWRGVRPAPGACDSPFLSRGLASVFGQTPGHCGCRFPGVPAFCHNRPAPHLSVCSVPSAASLLEVSLCEF